MADLPFGTTYDDSGQQVPYQFDPLGNPISPAGHVPPPDPMSNGLDSALGYDSFGLGPLGETSPDDQIAKWKDKGYIFDKQGRIWNASQSATVGTWDVRAWIDEMRKQGKTDDELKSMLDEGVTFDKKEDGSYESRGQKQPQAAGTTHGGKKAPTSSTPSTRTTPNPAPSSPTPPAPSTPSPSSPSVAPPNPGSVGDAPSLPPIGGAGPGANQQVNPFDINDPGRRAGPNQGVPASLFDFLPANFNQLGPEERMAAIIGAVTRRQEAGLETSLGRIDATEADRQQRRQGVRGLEDQILGDTNVMSEADIQRISGKATAAANQKANLLGQALAERRAAAGSARSGSAQTEQSAVLQNAMNTAINAESDIRAGARRENFNSRNAALGAVGQSMGQDASQGLDAQRTAAGAIEGSQVYGDAFLTQNLLNRESAQNPVYQTAQFGGKTIRERLA